MAQLWQGKRHKDLDDADWSALQRFITSQPLNMPFDNRTWSYARILGRGGEGVAVLFLQVDSNHEIKDQIVLKVVKHDADSYNDQRFYYERFDYPAPGMPREVYCQLVCLDPDERPNNNNEKILRLHTASWTSQYHWWRIYLEYAPFGSLDELILKQKARKRKCIKGNKYKYEQEVKLPQPFLWACFESLAIAAVAMLDTPGRIHMGQPNERVPVLRENNQGGEFGSEVVHKDLKPSNVFLTKPDKARFPMYPQVKIGDFGSARFTFPREPLWMNPGFYFGDGDVLTLGFTPPENDMEMPEATLLQPHGFADPTTNLPAPASVRLLSYTNIWQIGMIMRSLCLLHNENLSRAKDPSVFEQPYWDVSWIRPTPPENKDNWRPDVPWPGDQTITPPLEALILRCLATDPASRITPHQLLAETTSGVESHAHGLQAPDAKIGHSNLNNLKRLKLKHDYEIEMRAP